MRFFTRKPFYPVPSSIAAWVLTAATLIYLVALFIDIDRRSHSVSDTLINFVFNALLVAAAYIAVAFVFSSRDDQPSTPEAESSTSE